MTTGQRTIIGALILLAVLLYMAGARDVAVTSARAETLTWRQAQILKVRSRVHHCQVALGKDRRPVGERIVKGGPSYRLWVLRSWRRDERLNCGALRSLRRVPETWLRLGDCETGGDRYGRKPYRVDWDYNGRSGFDGGIQFHPKTWATNRPLNYPAYAWQAEPWQQVVVAIRLLEVSGWEAWPSCSRSVGLR